MHISGIVKKSVSVRFSSLSAIFRCNDWQFHSYLDSKNVIPG